MKQINRIHTLQRLTDSTRITLLCKLVINNSAVDSKM